MINMFAEFLKSIITFAGVNPLAAVLILLIVVALIIAAGAFVLAKLYLQLKYARAEKQKVEAEHEVEKEIQKKKEQGFVYTSGVINNFEINLRAMIEDLKKVVADRECCYFQGESGEPRRAAFFNIQTRLGALEKDVGEIKQVTVLRRG